MWWAFRCLYWMIILLQVWFILFWWLRRMIYHASKSPYMYLKIRLTGEHTWIGEGIWYWPSHKQSGDDLDCRSDETKKAKKGLFFLIMNYLYPWSPHNLREMTQIGKMMKLKSKKRDSFFFIMNYCYLWSPHKHSGDDSDCRSNETKKAKKKLFLWRIIFIQSIKSWSRAIWRWCWLPKYLNRRGKNSVFFLIV